jgi:hypothetical protein
VKSFGSTGELPFKLFGLRLEEESGTDGVKVKFVDIVRNACGEVGSLVQI